MKGILIGIGAPFLMVVALRRAFSVQPNGKERTLFVAGAAAAFVALVAEEFVWPFAEPLLPGQFALLIRAFLMIALIEEMAKLGLIYGQLTEGNAISYRAFAILAASVGAGFAGAENALYISHHGEGVVFMRTFTATPFHICNAVVASRMLWVAVREKKEWLLPVALISAVFLHGLYDYLIMADSVADGKFWFALAMTGSLAIGLLRRREA